MIVMDFLVLDVETCPLKLDGYFELSEADQKKLLNPIDSRIVAIGLRHGSVLKVIMGEDEKKMLEEFWKEFAFFKKSSSQKRIVGFNVKDFDLPVLVTRSFLNDVEIVPFNLNEVIDLREKLAAYKWGPTRGKLKEYGKALNIELHEMEGSDVAKACLEKNFKKIKEYLEKDLEITQKILERAVKTRIIEIERW